MPLAPVKTPEQLLDLYYHDLRSHLLELAAGFDRIERAGASADPRLDRLRQIAGIAVDEQPDRARRLLEELSV